MSGVGHCCPGKVCQAVSEDRIAGSNLIVAYGDGIVDVIANSLKLFLKHGVLFSRRLLENLFLFLQIALLLQ